MRGWLDLKRAKSVKSVYIIHGLYIRLVNHENLVLADAVVHR